MFKPESGLGDGALTRQELSDLLHLNHMVQKDKENNIPLLRLMLERNDVLRVRDATDTYTQTDEGWGSVSLEQKMREIDNS